MKINNYEDFFSFIKRSLTCVKCNNYIDVYSVHDGCNCGFIYNLFLYLDKIHLIIFEREFGYIGILISENSLILNFLPGFEEYEKVFEPKIYSTIFDVKIIEDINLLQNKILKLSNNLCFV